MDDVLFVLRAGVVLSAVAGALIVTLFLSYPRFFLNDFPEAVRAVVPPLSPREKLLGTLAGLPLLAALVGGPVATALAFDARHGGDAPATHLFLAAWGCFMVANLADWLLIDLLWLGRFPPRAATLPGAEHVPLELDGRKHATDFLKGSFGGAVVALVAMTAALLAR